MKIRGDRVVLRPVEKEDCLAIVAWNNDAELSRYYDGFSPKSPEECDPWHRALKSNRHNKSFAICTSDGQLIGDIELDHIAWRSGDAELRVRIGEKAYRGMGLGSDAVRTVLHYAFHTLNLSRIYLRVFDFNHRAIRCYLKCGFRKEGRLSRQSEDGRPLSVLLMTIHKDQFSARSRSA